MEGPEGLANLPQLGTTSFRAIEACFLWKLTDSSWGQQRSEESDPKTGFGGWATTDQGAVKVLSPMVGGVGLTLALAAP